MATIDDYKVQAQGIKDGADQDAIAEQGKIDSLKTSLKSEQGQQAVDVLVAAKMAELLDELSNMAPVAPASAPIVLVPVAN